MSSRTSSRSAPGPVLAALALRGLLGNPGHVGVMVPSPTVEGTFAVECGYSAVLALVIMGVATDERVPRSVAPFAIGATVFAGALVTGRSRVGTLTRPSRSDRP